MSRRSRFRRRLPALLVTLLVLMIVIWAAILLQQHAVLQSVMSVPPEWKMTTATTIKDSNTHSQNTVNPPVLSPAKTPSKVSSSLMNEDFIDNKKSYESPVPPKVIEKMDGTFNGVPFYFRSKLPQSTVHCVGDNNYGVENFSNDILSSKSHQIDAWKYRSCEYTHLCMDVQKHEYVLFGSQVPTNNESITVAIGGINPRWGQHQGFDKGIWKVQWSPRVVPMDNTNPWKSLGYYELDPQYTLVPFHSFAAHNVGHLMWDDLYPIFSLLSLFGRGNGTKLLPLRYQLPNKQQLYGSCDIRKNKRLQCANNFVKFWPLMGVDPLTFSTFQQVRVQIDPARVHSPLFCARTALAGLGMLTDHGERDHGWMMDEGLEKNGTVSSTPQLRDSTPPHNWGRGQNFLSFRNFMVQNILGDSPPTTRVTTLRVLFSLESSRDWDRRRTFDAQMDYLRQRLLETPDTRLEISSVRLWQMSLSEQIDALIHTDIFISTCGGGSVSASFLPPGASLIVYYNATGGFDFSSYQLTGQPARLDWDLFNNLPHLRVHWLPVNDMDEETHLELLWRLIEHEMEIINQDRYMSI
jgi:hypothetical protein